MKLVVGVDPGQKGALVLYSEANYACAQFYEMPIIASELNTQELLSIVEECISLAKMNECELVWYLEKPQSMPGNAAQAMLKYGWSIGVLEGVLVAKQQSYKFIHPATWCKEMHAGMPKDMKAKDKSAIIAKRLFPKLNFKRTPKCKKDDEGFVDAILISEFGARCESGRLQKKLS